MRYTFKALDGEGTTVYETLKGCCLVKRDVYDNIKLLNFRMKFIDFCVAYQNWQFGMLVQEAFPNLNNNEREFIMTGLYQEEWDAMFEIGE